MHSANLGYLDLSPSLFVFRDGKSLHVLLSVVLYHRIARATQTFFVCVCGTTANLPPPPPPNPLPR
jgi:hypothetical protein